MIFIIYTSCHSLHITDGYKLNSHLTCFQRGFIAQLVEHHTGIMEVVGSILGFICNCLSYYLTVRITFTCSIIIIHVKYTFSFQDDLTVKLCTNAYMLVYIRDSEMSE